MPDTSVQALLFDMGGVVLDVDFHKVFEALAPFSARSTDQLIKRFSMDEPYRLHETGEISGGEYIAHLRTQFELDANDAQITNGWNALFGEEITPALNAIAQVRDRFPCYGFTNTNALHQAHWEKVFPQIRRSFDRLFVSSEIGLRKPEPEAFAYIAQQTGVASENTLFFDDSQENIDGAAKVGLQCVLVDSPEAVVNALAALL